jgi:hypothetical protein
MFGLGRVHGRFRVTGGVVAIADRPEDWRVEAEIAASSFSTGNVIRYAHGVTQMPGVAARRLSVEISARTTKT